MTDTTATDVASRLRAAGVSGVLAAGDEGYLAALTGFNLTHVHLPAAVVVPGSVDDIAAAVRIADELAQPVAVIGLGHGTLAPIIGGVVIHTRSLAGVSVDPAAGTARVAAGTMWAEVIDAAAPHGLAPLCGSSPHVGAIGYLLGGGLSPIGRTYGFAADHIRSLTVVTADGSVVTADPESHADLFWALRGGKRGFGIVVEATIDLMPLRSLIAGGIFFAAADAAAVLHAFTAWVGRLPETVSTSIALLRLPPLPELPEPLRGQFVVHLRVAVTDTAERATELLQPMRSVARPLMDTIAEMPFAAIASVHQDPVDPMPVTDGGVMLQTFDDEAAATLLAAVGPDVSVPLVMVEVRLLGGAIARPPAVANAVGGREAGFSLFAVGVPVPELAGPIQATIRGLFEAMQPWRAATGQINFFGAANDPASWESCWPTEVAARLREIRAAYDPKGRFALRPVATPVSNDE